MQCNGVRRCMLMEHGRLCLQNVCTYRLNTSVISKRADLKTGVSRKQSTPKFPKNQHFLPPDTHTCVCVSGGKKCLFSRNFGMLCFLATPVLRFAYLPDSRRPVTVKVFYFLTKICKTAKSLSFCGFALLGD